MQRPVLGRSSFSHSRLNNSAASANFPASNKPAPAMISSANSMAGTMPQGGDTFKPARLLPRNALALLEERGIGLGAEAGRFVEDDHVLLVAHAPENRISCQQMGR